MNVKEWIAGLDPEVLTIHQGPGPYFWPVGKHGQQCGMMLFYDAGQREATTGVVNENEIATELALAGFMHAGTKALGSQDIEVYVKVDESTEK